MEPRIGHGALGGPVQPGDEPSPGCERGVVRARRAHQPPGRRRPGDTVVSCRVSARRRRFRPGTAIADGGIPYGRAYRMVGSDGHAIVRSLVEDVIDTCATCGHASSRPPCQQPVVMLQGCHQRVKLSAVLVGEQSTTITRRCTSKRPCKPGHDVEHRSTNFRHMASMPRPGSLLIVRQDPMEIVQESGPDGAQISMARRRTTVDVVPELAFQVGSAFFDLVGLVDYQGGDTQLAGNDEGHYISWVKQPGGSWAFCDTSRLVRYGESQVARLLDKRVYRLLFYRCIGIRL